jgi:hypothetical protein
VTAYCAAFIAGIDANRTVKDELAAAVARRAARRRISVTDLVNPRQAYFGRVRPEIQPSADHVQVMMAGTGFHEAFGRAVSTEEFVEQLVEFEEIVGKIDIFENAPVELKTTGSMPSDVVADRPSHVEQLAMYCTMVGKPLGHLLYYKRAEYGRAPQLRALDLEVTRPSEVAREMVRRRDLLRRALETNDPSALPQCEWAGRGCRYEKVCGCDTADLLVRAVSGPVAVRENPALAQRVREKVAAAGEAAPVRRIGLNDLVFPRKAAFRLGARDEGGDGEDAESRMASLQRRGFEEALKDAIWYGIPGACRRVRASIGALRASVMLFRDVPTVLRTTGRREMIERGRLAAEAPHYIDRLGFECALAGSDKGRLIVYYSAIPDDKFMVYELWYKERDRIQEEMQRRLALLEAGAAPEQLPPCRPEWMSRFCEFAPGCGCDRAKDSPIPDA